MRWAHCTVQKATDLIHDVNHSIELVLNTIEADVLVFVIVHGLHGAAWMLALLIIRNHHKTNTTKHDGGSIRHE